jgi:hypothetical protein
MFTLMIINGQPTLVMLPPDAVQQDPEMIWALKTSKEQRDHCELECPLHNMCVTYNAHTALRAISN